MSLTKTAIKLRINILSILLFCFVIVINTSVSAQSILTPHMAEYTLKMTNRNTSSPITSIDGSMLYTIDDECSAWSVSQKFKLFYLYNNQNVITEEKHFTNWEAKNGSSLEFASKSISNNVVNEALRGSASKEINGNGKALFSTPENLNFTLNNTTTFPNQYILELLKHAENGDKFFNNVMFDGADKEGPMEINSFISKKLLTKDIKELNNNKNINKELLGKYAWKIRMAFFPLNKGNSLPSHEIDLILHDNGVVSSATIIYKNFTISEHIQTLSTRPKHDC